MKVRSSALGALVALCLSVSTLHVAAAADRPYTEGTVTDVTSVRTEPGMFDDYMAWLAGPWKQQMEAQKAAGIIVDYAIYSTTPRGPHDPDLYLIAVYKNMAALDGMNEKLDPINEKLTGTLAMQNKQYADRSRLRTILGDEYIRELKLK